MRVRFYINLGAAQQLKGDLQAALDTWNRGLKIAPDNVDLSINIAQVLRLRGDTERRETLRGRP